MYLKSIVSLSALALCSHVHAANFATCVIETMPGVNNYTAYNAALNICSTRYPDKFFEIQRGSGKGVFSYKTSDSCVLDKTKNTNWQPAAALIKQSCDCLYTTPASTTDMCLRYTLPPEISNQHTITNDKQRLQIETHYRKIYAAHPDADSIFESRDFQAWWVNDKSRADTLTKGTTQQIINLMSEYKAQLQPRYLTDQEVGFPPK